MRPSSSAWRLSWTTSNPTAKDRGACPLRSAEGGVEGLAARPATVSAGRRCKRLSRSFASLASRSARPCTRRYLLARPGRRGSPVASGSLPRGLYQDSVPLVRSHSRLSASGMEQRPRVPDPTGVAGSILAGRPLRRRCSRWWRGSHDDPGGRLGPLLCSLTRITYSMLDATASPLRASYQACSRKFRES